MPLIDCLVVISTRERELLGKRFDLDKDTIRIGRAAGNDIVLPGDSISRRQCRLERRAGAWILIDDMSCAGTGLNDEMISTEAPMKDGDRIRIGPTVLKLLSGPDVMARYEAEIVRLRSTDQLTGIHNKVHFCAKLQREIDRGAAALVLFDFDRFLRTNDLHGHLAGDHVLKETARLVAAELGSDAVFARYAGDEFALLLPQTSLEDAVALAERLCKKVRGHDFVFHGDPIHVTFSAGVTLIRREDRAPQEVLARADEQTLRAKREGRDRVCAV